jgi:RNA polymerase primary sigma factor
MKVNTDNLNLPSGVFVNPNNKETFNRYMIDIKGLKPLSREEEVEMFKRIEATNDPIAIETICKHNLLFVVSVAKRYARTVGHSALTLEDLISEGNLGLHQAIQKFDYRTGNKFISFAIWQIKSLIRQSIQNNVKAIRMPANASTQLRRYSREEVITEKELERKPTAQEVHSNMLSKGLIKHKNETAEHFE